MIAGFLQKLFRRQGLPIVHLKFTPLEIRAIREAMTWVNLEPPKLPGGLTHKQMAEIQFARVSLIQRHAVLSREMFEYQHIGRILLELHTAILKLDAAEGGAR